MIGVGVVGCGRWGTHLIRNLLQLDSVGIVAATDVSTPRLQAMQQQYSRSIMVADWARMLSDARIDAIVVATPAATHHQLTMDALRSGRHVLVEKPIATTASGARELAREARRRDLTLMVGHTYIYSQGVRQLKNLIVSGTIGSVMSYDSVRVNLGGFRRDVDVLWDLAVHDIAILDYLIDASPVGVSATGVAHISGYPESVAFVTLFFPGSLVAHLHVSWLAPCKVRRIQINGTRQMVIHDELEPSAQLRLFDRGVVVTPSDGGSPHIGYREGGMTTVQLDAVEPLRTQLRHFVDCIQQRTPPLSDGFCGARAATVLETAALSMRERGRCIDLPDACRASD